MFVRRTLCVGWVALWLIAGTLCTCFLSRSASSSELRRHVIQSKYLNSEFPYVVYVPDGYETSNLQYPVLYLLHGALDNERTWSDKGLIQEKVDLMIESGAIPPTLIVMPGCTGCWWIDSKGANSESAFWHELVPEIESSYRAISRREGRLLAGLSAGGFGTVRFVMRYPEKFVAAAAFSPAVYADDPPAASNARVHPAFKDTDGRFSLEMWKKYNYPALIEGYFKQDARVPLFLAAGDNDRLGTAYETALLFKRILERQPIQVELRVIDGGHNWSVWASVIDQAMRYMYRFAAAPQPRGTPKLGATPGQSLSCP